MTLLCRPHEEHEKQKPLQTLKHSEVFPHLQPRGLDALFLSHVWFMSEPNAQRVWAGSHRMGMFDDLPKECWTHPQPADTLRTGATPRERNWWRWAWWTCWTKTRIWRYRADMRVQWARRTCTRTFRRLLHNPGCDDRMGGTKRPSRAKRSTCAVLMTLGISTPGSSPCVNER
jgi:hypothetical protein